MCSSDLVVSGGGYRDQEMVVFFIVLVGRDLSTMYIKENSVKKLEMWERKGLVEGVTSPRK